MTDLYDLGQFKKQEGMAQVWAHQEPEWKDDARMALIVYARPDFEFTSADFRAWYATQGGWEPKHPNAWGSLFNTAVKRKLIRPTGRYRQSCITSAHRRMVVTYTGPTG